MSAASAGPETGATAAFATRRRRRCVLDCDPGHDDMMAIILAGYSTEIDLIGITTVGGNQTLEKTTHNALRVITMAGMADRVDVVPGQSTPLMLPNLICPEIHGESGLDGAVLPEPAKSELPKKAVLWLHELVSGSPEPVTLICTGRLTNVALFLTLFPEDRTRIEEIVLMGGAIGLGNTHPCSEFNIQTDPEAAKVVLESGLRVVMVPLEVTHTALVTPEICDSLMEMRSAFASAIRDLLLFFAASYRDVFGFVSGPPLHDPCAVCYVVAPELFETRHVNVTVITGDSMAAGRTVCDLYGVLKRPPNVHVAVRMDVPAFWSRMLGALRAANAQSPMNM